jgi:hypothetical protein
MRKSCIRYNGTKSEDVTNYSGGDQEDRSLVPLDKNVVRFLPQPQCQVWWFIPIITDMQEENCCLRLALGKNARPKDPIQKIKQKRVVSMIQESTWLASSNPTIARKKKKKTGDLSRIK